MKPSYRKRPALPLAVLLLAISAGPALAQGGRTSVEVRGGATTPAGSTNFRCGHFVPTPGNKELACENMGISGTAFAATDAGQLSARATIAGAQDALERRASGHSTGTAIWRDVLTSSYNGTSTSPAFIEFMMHANGTSTATSQRGSASTTVDFVLAINGANYRENVIMPAPDNGTATTSYELEQTVRVPYDSNLRFTLALSANTFIFLSSYLPFDPIEGRPGGLAPDSGSAEIDFSHTAVLGGLAFLNADGRDVTNDMTYSFTHGARIYPMMSTVPEPGTVVLLGTGMLALSVVVGRMRRQPLA